MAGGMHGRVCVWQEGACVVGGMCGRGACMAGGVLGRGACIDRRGVRGRGHAWQGMCVKGGMHGRGACIVGGGRGVMHGRR